MGSEIKRGYDRPVPTRTGNPLGNLEVYHPGYTNAQPALLRFLAVDDGGVDYDVVYYACCILVGNDWAPPRSLAHRRSASGPSAAGPSTSMSSMPVLRQSLRNTGNYPFLSTSIDPSNRQAWVTRSDDNIIRKERIYLHVPKHKGDKPYPITANFLHWIFPHGNLPPPWRSLPIRGLTPLEDERVPRDVREAVFWRDDCCRMTQCRCGLEAAHLVPRKDLGWFIDNGMQQYCADRAADPAIDDLANEVLLRADVYTMIDRKELLVVPKRDNEQTYTLVTHLLRSENRYIHDEFTLFHNSPFQPLKGISIEYLFARFAWAIFNRATIPFFQTIPAPIEVRVRIPGRAGEPLATQTRSITSGNNVPAPPFSTTIFGGQASKKGKGSGDDNYNVGNSDDTDDDDNYGYGCGNRCPIYYSLHTGEMVCPIHDGESDDDSGSESDSDFSLREGILPITVFWKNN
ncbi:hypothetical protein GGS26DRAFT_122280 [Hypomontagnella submonticulosa]|nr:hypothetical protein GGS26DRAFT_122280 [Hypomontagnella submonticulosa]